MTTRVLLTGWFSFLHGEATAGDVLALDAVRRALDDAGLGYDVAWSPVFRPGALRLEDADPDRYTHLVFVCGPVHGAQIDGLHTRFAALRRIAVGVTVIDRNAPAYTGFDLVLARDGDLGPALRDLSAAVPALAPVPVVGVVLATGQGEYGERRRHETVADQLASWLAGKTCAPVPLETRLDTRDWRLCSTADAFQALLSRLDVVVTTRLHGLALALRAGIPALAIDPVEGGGKVTAQASAWGWPAMLPASQAADYGRLDTLWDWCLSPGGRRAAAGTTRAGRDQAPAMLTALLADLRRTPEALGRQPVPPG
ncbi:MAG TPA: polysaccharide pyruvyl transferase family protein [Streptosporangiaceae bacterium]|nr:polysaccharide pyruvyl transferase family protein [Streptosporangiaceae bacterium]